MPIEPGLFGDVPTKIYRFTVTVPTAIAAKIREYASRPDSGEVIHKSGGYQDVTRDTARRLNGHTIDADDCYIGKVYRYSLAKGGWENVFLAILRGVKVGSDD